MECRDDAARRRQSLRSRGAILKLFGAARAFRCAGEVSDSGIDSGAIDGFHYNGEGGIEGRDP